MEDNCHTGLKGPQQSAWGGLNLVRFLDGICIYYEKKKKKKKVKCAIIEISRKLAKKIGNFIQFVVQRRAIKLQHNG